MGAETGISVFTFHDGCGDGDGGILPGTGNREGAGACPRELSAGCGIARRMEPAEYERFQGVIAEAQIEDRAELCDDRLNKMLC